MLGIQRARLDIPRYKWALLMIAMAATGVFNLLGCGFVVVHWYGDIIFKSFFDSE